MRTGARADFDAGSRGPSARPSQREVELACGWVEHHGGFSIAGRSAFDSNLAETYNQQLAGPASLLPGLASIRWRRFGGEGPRPCPCAPVSGLPATTLRPDATTPATQPPRRSLRPPWKIPTEERIIGRPADAEVIWLGLTAWNGPLDASWRESDDELEALTDQGSRTAEELHAHSVAGHFGHMVTAWKEVTGCWIPGVDPVSGRKIPITAAKRGGRRLESGQSAGRRWA